MKVFLLVGQSNMQGKGSVKHLEELTGAEPDKFGHLVQNGKWVERDDVWIFFSSRKAGDLPTSGRLTVGYGLRPPGKMVGFMVKRRCAESGRTVEPFLQKPGRPGGPAGPSDSV